jgi:hypothetical protein
MGIVRLLVPTGRCPGYGIDHIKRVKEGGADEPWRTGKDAFARSACATHGFPSRVSLSAPPAVEGRGAKSRRRCQATCRGPCGPRGDS